MRLRNITMKGFKSFANETSLNFNEDVIGVVGPNGSGKSNVVDAVRWVLGEQSSRELRLDKMTDVIFNGTRKRKEAPTAQVTLTFENDKGILPIEYTTVAISRYLYRSGESEYRLNDVKCRLKDISTLLMDTGMGSNSYAIIALGMVDDILADKDHARRHMFEQAAGISKYKKRKKDTHNKLKATTADLDRVEDLIFEIEGNLKSLERQAKRAQKYLDIKATYKEKSLLHARISVNDLKNEYKNLASQIDLHKKNYGNIDVSLRTKEAVVEKIKKDNLEQEQAVSKQQRKLNEVTSELRKLESDKELKLQKQDFKKQSDANINKSIQNLEIEINRFQEEIKSIKNRYDNESEVLKELESKRHTAEQKLKEIKVEHSEKKVLSNSRIKERNELSNRIYDLDKQMAIHENTKVNLLEDLSRRNEALKDRKSNVASTMETLKKIEDDLLLKSKESVHLQESEQDRKSSIERLRTDKDELTTSLNDLNRRIDAQQNEYDLIKNMIDNLEGYPESTKYLDKHWESNAPILSDLLDVKDEYKLVIEQYLDNYLNYYVVDDLTHAKQAIGLLTAAQKGRANFFLLNDIPDTQEILSSSPSLSPASYYVNTDIRYQALINYLLQDVFIYTGELDGLLDAEKGKTYLSTSGQFMVKPYSVTGGSVGLFEGKKIGRKKSLEKLAISIKKLGKEKEKTEQDINAIKFKLESLEKKDKSTDLKKLDAQINALNQDKIKLSHQIDSFHQYEEEFIQKEENTKVKISELDESISNALSEKTTVETQYQKIDKISESSEEALEQLNDLLSNASQSYNQLNIEYIRQQNHVQNLNRDFSFKQKRKQESEENLRKDKIRLKDIQQEIQDLNADIERIKAELVDLYVVKDDLRKNLSDVEQSYFDARNKISSAEDEIKVLQRQQNQIQLQVQELRDQHSDVKFKMSSVSERLKIEFDIALNDIINDELPEDIDTQEISDSVIKLRDRLSRYGDVNPMAVESYNEMKDRHELIINQRNDILEAKDSLLETIKEIEETATEMYMDSFSKVRSNFIEVFRSLFSEEDDCDLVLIDHENPLDSDIDIIAKPKGKKPKSLSQLSGGEKTLTATALLFALYLLKPAPFCIFDEVDAPLDDANIQKFNKIIKKFSKDSQFIIVTHNKSTMTAVDILYGVYMQEQGVSSVTPVDFRSLDNDEFLETLN